MSSVPPLLTPNLPPSAPAAPAAAEVVVVQAPPQAAAQLAALKLLEGLVLAQRDGLAQLKTDLGNLQLKLPFPVPEGARLTLVPGSTPGDGSWPGARLALVDGRPPTPAMLAGRLAPLPSLQRPAVDLAGLGGGNALVQATLLKPAATAPGLAAPLAIGTTFTARLQPFDAPALPAHALPTGTGAAAPAATATTSAAAPAGASAAAAMPGLTPSPGSAAAATSSPGVPATSPSPAPATAASGAAAPAATPTVPTVPPNLTGTVAPNTHAGQPLVQTELGLLALCGSPALPPGTRVTLQISGPAVLPEAATPALPTAGGPWSGLSQAIASLGQNDPAAAARLSGALPQLGPHLAENMVAFAAAAQSGTLRQVFGERAALALERAGRGDAARRLIEDLRLGEPQSQRDTGGEWRVMQMPLLNGDVVEPIRLYLRRPDAPEDGEDGNGGRSGDQGQRFVVDVTLSSLGRLQIDGLMRRSNKRLDVLVRSAVPLPAEMRADISRIFADCCSASGVSGEAGFQVTRRFLEPVSAAAQTGILA